MKSRPKDQYVSSVLKGYIAHKYSKNIEQAIQQWLLNKKHAQAKEEALQTHWDSIQLDKHPNKSVYEALARVNERIGISTKEKKSTPLFSKRLLRVAAVMLPLLFIAGSYFYFEAAKEELKPKQIVVVKGVNEEQQLADGTHVTAKPGSQLVYAKTFSGASRKVELVGEASFVVTRNEKIPFEVETKQLTVTVLGTVFSVQASPNQALTMVTLMEGSVKVQSRTGQERVLTPNQLLVYHHLTDQMEIQIVAQESTEEGNDTLNFQNKTLAEILNQIEQAYNIVFKVNKNVDLSEHFNLRLVKNESRQHIISLLTDLLPDLTLTEDAQTIWVEKRK